MSEYRILITGSRSWDNETRVAFALGAACSRLLNGTGGYPNQFTVVHGACPTGADAIADRIARDQGMHVETHAADWTRQGKAAGFIRNAAMVDLGADICLAFLMPCEKAACTKSKPHDSHGTTHCLERAAAAGIEVRNIRSGAQ